MLNETDKLTHMPFLTRNLQGQRVLLYSEADDCADAHWSLRYCIGDDEPKRLETGFSHGKIECSPTAWQDESGWHVSFVSNSEPGGMVYRLYRMDGPTLDSLSQPVSMRIARTGFVYKDRIAIGEVQDLVHVHDNSGDHKIEIPGAFLYRVSYRADEPNKLLISGDWIGETADPFTIEYDLDNDTQRFIECDGQGAYKCTIYGDEILYADRMGEHFEKRQIRRAERVNKIRCQVAHRHRSEFSAVLLQTTKKCGCRRNEKDDLKENPARPSCIECVEKHLGAAFVILSEIANGYSYRLRFVGHLHEAEDESEEWPMLHSLIRESRKEYQKHGTPPDWEALGKELEAVKNAC